MSIFDFKDINSSSLDCSIDISKSLKSERSHFSIESLKGKSQLAYVFGSKFDESKTFT